MKWKLLRRDVMASEHSGLRGLEAPRLKRKVGEGVPARATE